MAFQLAEKNQRLINRFVNSGAYPDADHVVSAALEALAEESEDAAVIAAREHEPRISLEEAEAELRKLGKID